MDGRPRHSLGEEPKPGDLPCDGAESACSIPAAPAGDCEGDPPDVSDASEPMVQVVLAKNCRPEIRRAVKSTVLLARGAKVFAVTDIKLKPASEQQPAEPSKPAAPATAAGAAAAARDDERRD